MYSSGGQIFHLLLGFKPNHYCKCIFKQIFPLYYFIYKRMSYNKIQIVYELVVDLESLSNNWIVIFNTCPYDPFTTRLSSTTNDKCTRVIYIIIFVCLFIWWRNLILCVASQTYRICIIYIICYNIVLYILYSIPMFSRK